MRHQYRVAKLGLPTSHRKAVLANLARQMVIHAKVRTTDARAKEVRRIVERLITYAKRNTVHTRRLAYSLLQDRDLVKKLFDHIGPQYANRNGGYTRIVKLGYRDNDNAAISLLEFVDYKLSEDEKKAKEKQAAAKAKRAEAAKKKAEAAEKAPVETEESPKE
jgi:large subunit ribosomal protein L17